MPKRRIRYNVSVKVPEVDEYKTLNNAKARDARIFIMTGLNEMYNYSMEEMATQQMLHDLCTINRRKHYNHMILSTVQVTGIYF